jgi:hypothetical protein
VVDVWDRWAMMSVMPIFCAYGTGKIGSYIFDDFIIAGDVLGGVSNKRGA